MTNKFKCYYELNRFIYFKNLLDNNGFLHCGNGINGIRKVAGFISDDFNVYVDCGDREYPDAIPTRKTVEHAAGKPFLYFKTAYSPTQSILIKKVVEDNGGTFEPFFKWCGANLDDGFYFNLYKKRKEFIELNKKTAKSHDVGFCCSFEHPVKSVSVNRKNFYMKFKDKLGNKFYHNSKLDYNKYIMETLKWKTSFNCPGVGEYTSRIMDACSIGGVSLLSQTDYDNAISWKDYIPQINFEDSNWDKELLNVIENYKDWANKCLYYYENYWTPDFIFNYFGEKINKFREEKL